MIIVYAGAELPSISFDWKDDDGNLINFDPSVSWSWSLKILGPTSTLTRTSGIEGSSVSPNITITIATSGDMTALLPGEYRLSLTATRASDSKSYVYQNDLVVRQVAGVSG